MPTLAALPKNVCHRQEKGLSPLARTRSKTWVLPEHTVHSCLHPSPVRTPRSKNLETISSQTQLSCVSVATHVVRPARRLWHKNTQTCKCNCSALTTMSLKKKGSNSESWSVTVRKIIRTRECSHDSPLSKVDPCLSVHATAIVFRQVRRNVSSTLCSEKKTSETVAYKLILFFPTKKNFPVEKGKREFIPQTQTSAMFVIDARSSSVRFQITALPLSGVPLRLPPTPDAQPSAACPSSHGSLGTPTPSQQDTIVPGAFSQIAMRRWSPKPRHMVH